MKRKGFTLAEVLITLAIIGIVAAMTIPLLIASSQKNATVEKLKKFYSIMTQAIKLSELDNGRASSWTYPASADGAQTLTWFNTYIAPYIKYEKIDAQSWGINVYLSDGTSMQFYMSTTTMEPAFFTEPNKTDQIGRNVFYWQFNTTGKANVLQPYDNGTSGTGRTKWLSGSNACTTSGTKKACAGLIINDGWQILDSYPW